MFSLDFRSWILTAQVHHVGATRSMELRLSLGTSSIEQLPTEILLQIFKAARTKIKKRDLPKYAHPDPDDAEGRLMTEFVPRRALLCLARTCRRFRDVVDKLLAQHYEELEVELREHHRWEPLPKEYFAFRRKQHLVRFVEAALSIYEYETYTHNLC